MTHGDKAGTVCCLKIATLLVALSPELLFLGAGVQLRDNGYDGLLIAINPQVSEDQNLIPNIKEMVTEASFYLFNATKRRVFFRNTKILIPATWKANNYSKVKQESYEKANVIVTASSGAHGGDPYTLQYRGCGKEGKHIYFTPDFLLNDDLTAGYGSRGRVFVHEWAHLRWGVFDEYNNEKPFYINGQNQIKVTRCSSDITGIFVCEKGPCPQENCIISELFQGGCMFLYNSTQNAAASIMFMQSLSSVVEFCNASTHNQEAPNRQNQMCSLRSTWDVISDSTDFHHSSPMNGTELPPPPTFSLVQAGDKVVCLVLDVSSKMAEADRLLRLEQAAEFYLMQIVESHTFVGIVSFNSNGEIRAQLHQINNDDDRKLLVSHLPATVSADPETSICSGLKRGFEVAEKLNGKAYGSVLILVTSGHDEHISNCLLTVLSSGSTIHTIALGASVDKNLEELSHLTVTWQTSGPPDIELFEPNGRKYYTHNFTINQALRTARLWIPGTAQPGPWTYALNNTHHSLQSLKVTVTSRASHSAQPPATVEAFVEKDSTSFPHPVMIYANVRKGFYPILNATVTATIEPETEEPVTLKLLDDGAGADVIKNDGIYSRYFFSFAVNGRYSLKVHVNHSPSISALGLHSFPGSHAMYVPGYITNGNIQMNVPRKSLGRSEEEQKWGFSRTSSGGSFSVLGVPTGPHPDTLPPCRIIDLEAVQVEEEVTLSWTAPGEDFDQGQANSYEIRMSKSLQNIQDDFNNAILVNTSKLNPQPAGTKEIFTFSPKLFINGPEHQPNGETQESHRIYVAIRTIDKNSLKSAVSNIAQASLFILPNSAPVLARDDLILKGVLIAMGLIGIICLTIVVTHCILNKKRRADRKENGIELL
ncbi:PREDICTED: calcium-activated chloride channel regulator 2 isoform X2 [Myotis brandtii]|uniref:calcium-activated chloride channel regulator 2 isoform X2 n=1 Tax=Myotis brandtii TaxID=109478 RepID=UPI00070401D2|nr:PREDICTED: calcium-activated chloride channel regulator 2 isoform X2 [Myotis brandtii]